MRLHTLSNDEHANRIHSRPDKGDTSQAGNYGNFRNQHFRNKPIRLTPNFFLDMPRSGVLEFDYVVLLRHDERVRCGG